MKCPGAKRGPIQQMGNRGGSPQEVKPVNPATGCESTDRCLALAGFEVDPRTTHTEQIMTTDGACCRTPVALSVTRPWRDGKGGRTVVVHWEPASCLLGVYWLSGGSLVPLNWLPAGGPVAFYKGSARCSGCLPGLWVYWLSAGCLLCIRFQQSPATLRMVTWNLPVDNRLLNFVLQMAPWVQPCGPHTDATFQSRIDAWQAEPTHDCSRSRAAAAHHSNEPARLHWAELAPRREALPI